MSPANGGDRDDEGVEQGPVSGIVQALPLPSTDDGELVRAAAAGHPGAAKVIWDRYSRLVRSLLRRSMGPEGEVEDLLQEVFLRFFERAGTLRDTGALRQSFVPLSDEKLAGVGAVSFYSPIDQEDHGDLAAVHQFGAPAKNLPARPMLPTEDRAMSVMTQVYAMDIQRAVKS